MNIVKKFMLRYKNQIFYSLAMVICALGAYIANLIEDQNRVLAHGIVGGTVLYLIYLVFLSPKRIINDLLETPPEYPEDIKYLFFGFFITMVMFWAAGQIIDLVRYLLYGLASK
jgi:hypothetical protein